MDTFEKVAFYFIAHADDWQLFMTPEISGDIANKKCKLFIIHTTAGDAGKDDKYWKARELAAMESLLFRISVAGHLHQKNDACTVKGKEIIVRGINNCCCYFLRLPDGAYDGSGFETYEYQSLEKFRTGKIEHLTSVDNTVTYNSWDELTEMIDEVIKRELDAFPPGNHPEVCINIPEYDLQLNPFDHNDHYNTSLLVKNTKAYKKYPVRAFLTYNIINNDNYLSGEDLFWKIGMFTSYHQSLFREYGHSTISEDKSFIPWCLHGTSYRDIRCNE